MAAPKDQDKQTSKTAEAEKGSAGVPQAVMLGENIEIFPDQPLPQYDVGPNKAYKASSKSRGEPIYALVCMRHLIPRFKAAGVYTAFVNPSLLPLVRRGKVFWPAAGQERYVLIYKNILGEPIMKAGDKAALGWKQDPVVETVIRPLVGLLQDFQDKDFVHGSIRPSNMFTGIGADKGKRVILGDCLSVPCSYKQPALYETIERSMTDPIGRGEGTLPDDMYSFGVALAVILRGQDPMNDMDDEQIIREKIKLGSYAAITGKDRFKGSVLELLRGLLHDDATQRWTVDEVVDWMDGRRLTPKQAVRNKTAARPFTLCNEKFFQAPILSLAIDILPAETAKVVEDESLEQWLERSLEDQQAVERLQDAHAAALSTGSGAGYEDRLVANLSTALDPMAPIRFRGLRLMGDGIGAALYEVMVLKQDVKAFADIFLQNVALNWATLTENPNVDAGGLIGKFDGCRGHLRQTKLGYGIERCLYILAPEAPCLSPNLVDYFVATPEDMILAYEDMCEKGKAPGVFIDRHIAAFLSVNESKVIDGYLFDLMTGAPHKKAMASLRCFAALQKRCALKGLPNLAEAFVKLLKPVMERYHDKDVRDEIERDVAKHAKAGDLNKIVALLDDKTVADRDLRAFRGAMMEYAELRAEHATLKDEMENGKSFGMDQGRKVAAMFSVVLAVIVIAVSAFKVVAMSSGSNFY